MVCAAFSPTHDARILMTRRNVLDIANGPDGMVIHRRCNGGHEGLTDRHGSHELPIAASPSNQTERSLITVA